MCRRVFNKTIILLGLAGYEMIITNQLIYIYIYRLLHVKGLAKLGNIVAETMFLVMFPGVAKLGNICFGRKILCPGSKNVFDSRQKPFLFSEQQNLFPQHMSPARLNWKTFASATMFPSLTRP